MVFSKGHYSKYCFSSSIGAVAQATNNNNDNGNAPLCRHLPVGERSGETLGVFVGESSFACSGSIIISTTSLDQKLILPE